MTLANLHARLSDIYKSIQSFDVSSPQLPIIDVSLSNEKYDRDDREPLPGLRFLREEVKRDCDSLHKRLREHGNQPIASISTNAPYLIAVWDELAHAHQPVAIYRTFSLESVDREGNRKARRKGTTPQEKKASKNSHREVKVDVVADNGVRWVRVNTITNSRLMMEFREIDSYVTSSDEGEDKLRPSLSRTEFDNSVLRMGRQLLAAARANPVSAPGPLFSLVALDCDSSATTVTPGITLRLTRLDPAKDDSADPRIERTVQCLHHMGLDVQLGERSHSHLALIPKPRAQLKLLEPTTNINLDLSALIALVSDITHSPLPQTAEEARARFEPPQSYLEWKKDRAKSLARQTRTSNLLACGVDSESDEGTWGDSGQHSRALAAQVMQEMQKGILDEIYDRVATISSDHSIPQTSVIFWTTSEARLRCLQIVSKIGGERERRRADALLGSIICSRTPPVPTPAHAPSFPNRSMLDMMSESMVGMDDDAEVSGIDAYWIDSRYPSGFLPLVPIRVYPSTLPAATEDKDQRTKSVFFSSLARMCTGILSSETVGACLSQVSAPSEATSSTEGRLEEIPPAKLSSLPKLTVHTAASMLAGASRGHTTLTTNRSSVKAVLTGMWRFCGRRGCELGIGDVDKAALWVLGPRSLSEGMRSK